MPTLRGSLDSSHASFMGNAAIAQFLPLLSAPVIARLYAPADFGAYAVFVAFATLLGSSAPLALQNAILLEKNDHEAAHAFLLALIVSVAVSLLFTLCLVALPQSFLLSVVGAEALPLFFWLPATIILTSTFQCAYTWCIRQRYYRRLGRNKLVLAVVTMVVQISIGLTAPDARGFVFSSIIGYCCALLLLAGIVRGDVAVQRPRLSLASLHRHFMKRIALPLYTLPATLVNTVSSFLPDLLINRLYGVHLLGQYSLASRTVNMPLAFISTSIQDIFRQQASAEFARSGHCRSTFRTFSVLMASLSLLVVVPLILVLPWLIPIVFGKQWDESGMLVRALVFLIAIRFVSSPLSYVWIIVGRQRIDLLWQVGLAVLAALSFLAPQAILPGLTLEATLWIFSGVCGLWYLVCIMISRSYAHSPPV